MASFWCLHIICKSVHLGTKDMFSPVGEHAGPQICLAVYFTLNGESLLSATIGRFPLVNTSVSTGQHHIYSN